MLPKIYPLPDGLITEDEEAFKIYKKEFLKEKSHIINRLPSSAEVSVTYICTLEMELYLVIKIPKKDFDKLPADLKKLLTESDDVLLYVTENGEIVEQYEWGVRYV